MHIGDVLKVFVKAVHPSNGRFRLTLDPDITPEKANRMKNAAIRTKSRFSMRKQAADLEPGEEILGEIVKASLTRLSPCRVNANREGGRFSLPRVMPVDTVGQE